VKSTAIKEKVMGEINDLLKQSKLLENIKFEADEILNLNSNGNISSMIFVELKLCEFAKGFKIESKYDVHITIVFKQCTFSGFFEFDCRELLGTSSIIFDNCRFENNLNIGMSRREIKLSFENCVFFKEIIASGNYSEISFINKNPENSIESIRFVELNSSKIDVKGYNAASISFESNNNLRKLKISDSSISTLNLDFVTIGGVEIEETDINQLVSGKRTIIENYFRIKSEGSKKISSIKVEESKMAKEVIIERINMVTFNFLPATWDNIEIFKVRYCIIERFKIDHAKLKKDALFSDFTSTRVFHSERETFGYLKAQMERLNNKVDAFYFSAYELKALKESLSWKNSLEDKLVLTLNWESNRINTSPLRGVVFTFFVAQMFFIIYLSTLAGWKFSLDFWHIANARINEYWTNFFHFFTLTHPLTFMSSYGSTGWSYLVDVLGRIFIGYGIYQTVQAFRKYGKN
jgi:hypothetical protein